ncbi:hypothetical protein IWW55_003189 [Coemansia sp. RSA 2706]|nr:hypothetical protein IWW55_003189 [Coemansia sp. RSA 2706]KAJ2311014.1 hypothetical protein IWW52_005249 [Coemansia sp. RSA 2704]KAJ2324266.1 hypothetical protein IWW51_003356 [Coemansia sp. RSA 2702]KAJ2364749.1 hypothetical protein H4S01_003612 [Coemansia sp. RSA 2610]KAJ2390299.1 hypothetical protein H4S02_001936 [Coemansia sp. RSA 2611]
MPSRTPPPAVRINIPTVNISEAWAPAPLRKQRVLGTRLVRFYLPCVLLLSLVVNIYYITRPAPLALPSTLASTRQDGATGHRGVAEADLGQLTDLVVVPGHGVYLGAGSPLDEANWYLLAQQRGEVGAFMAHIGKGVEMVKEHEQALLVFSGGQTRVEAGAHSEAQGYWAAAERMGWLTNDVFRRVVTEEFARDSLENVLFSIARFHELTGNYPDRITVVGFEFKRERFVNLHRRALQYPRIRFNYIGINPPGDAKRLAANEKKDGYDLFARDLYACAGPLADKRRSRNPFRMSHGYARSCPEIAPLFDYCPATRTAAYEGDLPWLN